MRTQGFRRVLLAGSVSVVLGAGGVATAGPAEAASTTVLSSCVSAVQGEAGQAVALDPASVTQPIVDALTPLDPLNAIRPVFLSVWHTLPPIGIGSFPAPGGQTLITGAVIANAVVGQLDGIPVLSPVLEVLTQRVWAVLSQACGVVVQGLAMVGTALGAAQPSAATTAPGGPAGTPPTSGSPNTGSPAPSTTTGPATGTTPWSGGPTIGNGGLPPDGFAVSNAGPAAPLDLNGLQQLATEQTAGHAEPLPDTRAAIGRGIILAALILALVAAQLTRRWALRRGMPKPWRAPAR